MLSSPADARLPPDGPELVAGLRCRCGQLNHPRGLHCRCCGSALLSCACPDTGPRPAIGVLLGAAGRCTPLVAPLVLRGTDRGRPRIVRIGVTGWDPFLVAETTGITWTTAAHDLDLTPSLVHSVTGPGDLGVGSARYRYEPLGPMAFEECPAVPGGPFRAGSGRHRRHRRPPRSLFAEPR